MTRARHEDTLCRFDELRHDLRVFMQGVVSFIGEHPSLTRPGNEIVHSFKSRIKDREHLREKLERKSSEGRKINADNLFTEVTDLAGVRIMHLFQDDFREIDTVISSKIKAGDWVKAERTKAYTWDPEAAAFFKQFEEIEVIQKSTSYTSVHYLLRPRAESPICCEVQVRTLFEEIWGEVDHKINYPTATTDLACKEQIMVLSKIVGAGSRLLDSLHRVHNRGAGGGGVRK